MDAMDAMDEMDEMKFCYKKKETIYSFYSLYINLLKHNLIDS